MSKDMDLLALQNKIQEFRGERGWLESDSTYILAKSVFVEASELLECFQFDEDGVDLAAVKSEIADVLMYALSLCYDAGWHPEDVILEKLEDVARRYPKVSQ